MSTESVLRSPVAVESTADRYIYMFMAVLFIVTAIVGFAPTSLALVSAVAGGERPFPPIHIHVHAVAMTAWLALLLVQTSLMATGRSALHRKLGMAWLVVAPTMIASMIAMTVVPIVLVSRMSDTEITRFGISIGEIWSFLLTQLQAILLCALFVTWAFLARRKDSEMHKRMMILATVVPLSAAFGRMVQIYGLPGNGLFDSHLVPDLYTVLLLAPVLIHDVVRRGRLHAAYVIGLALILSATIAAHVLFNSSLVANYRAQRHGRRRLAWDDDDRPPPNAKRRAAAGRERTQKAAPTASAKVGSGM